MPHDEIRRMVREVAEEVFGRNPDATFDELNEVLARRNEEYNRRPQPELHGLSPHQAGRLLYDDWSGNGVVRIRDDLPLGELQGSALLANARLLLSAIAAKGEVKATGTGNLPRAIVGELREVIRLPPGVPRRWIEAARNEEDAPPLHETRVLLEVARLLMKRKGKYRVTRRGASLLEEARAGELQALLFRTYFRGLNLAYFDGYPEAPEFQQAIGVSLHLLKAGGRAWRTPAEIADGVLLPFVPEAVPDPTGRTGMLERRLLIPLSSFGLLEVEETPSGGYFLKRRYRLAPLYHRMLATG
jgi:hypothetical protein